jgi:hypothetical protein
VRALAATAFIALSASAATPPECDVRAVPRQIWKDPDTGNFWYCDRDTGWSQIQTSGSGSCAIAGAGDAGCIAAFGKQTVSPEITFAADAGFANNVFVGGGIDLPGGLHLKLNAPYLELSGGPLLLPTGVSGLVQGILYMNPSARLQSNIGNGGVVIQGNCDATDDTCEELVVNTARLRSAGWALKVYNFGQPYGGVRVDGTMMGGGGQGGNGFGVGRAAFQQIATGVDGVYNGYTTLGAPDSNPLVLYGSVFGHGGGDTAMGNGARGALGGPHGSVIVADHYTTDGGWAFEVDSFRAGPTPGSKVAFIDWAGGYGEYGWSGYLPKVGLSTPIGNQRATFPACPTIERDVGGGVTQYVGSGGESVMHWDFTPGGTGGWYACNEEDGGTEGSIDLGGGHTAVGYTLMVDAWHLSHGYGVVDGGFQGNVSVDGWISCSSSKCKGATTLSGGTKSVVVNSGAVCTCSSVTANNVRCSVSGNTLTVSGTGTDAFSYICL